MDDHSKFGWVERDGQLVCGFCGSVTFQAYMNAKVEDIIATDKDYKVYVIIDGKQYKFYRDHYEYA